MKAAIYRGPRNIRVEEVPEPQVSGSKILVRFKAGSICGTDLHFYRGEWKWMRKGRIIGHDACGVRADTGERVKEITRRGSDVVVEAAGTVRTVEQTPFLVRKAGKVALVGESKGYLNLKDADEALFFTSYISPVEYPLAVELISKKIVDVMGLVTHKFRLVDFEKASQTADDPEKKSLKIVITE